MKIYIDKNEQYQTFESFGASGAWWAQIVGGWENIDSKSGLPTRDRIAQLLYNPINGIGLRIYRYNIGGGSAQSGKGNFPKPTRRTESFDKGFGKYDFSCDANAVYMMKQAVKEGASEVILFVNSPVERLTNNGKTHGDKTKSFRDNLSRDNYEAFAKYCLDVAEHFIDEGLPIKYLSPVNEPMWAWVDKQEGCYYRPKSVGEITLCFAQELDKRPNLSNLRLSGIEYGDLRWFNKTYTKNMLKHKEVVDKIDALDIHSYCATIPLPFVNNRVAYLKRFRKWMDKNYPNIPLKMSEWTHMKKGRDTGMKSALVMAKTMCEDISISNVISWQHWVAVSDVDFCDGLIYIDLESKTFETTKRLYATGNFSKYIPENSVRVGTRCDDKNLMTIAFVKDSKTVLIVVNNSEYEKQFSLTDNSFPATLVVTDKNNDLQEYQVDTLNIKITPQSVNTVVIG